MSNLEPAAPDNNLRPALFRALLGPKHQDYYLHYFQRAEQRGYAPRSWHWPALFLGMFWLLYRRMVGWALLYLGLSYLALMLGTLLGLAVQGPPPDGEPPSGLLQVLPLLFVAAFQFVWFPLHANGIYYKWACQRLALVRSTYPHNQQEQERILTNLGGANLAGPLLLLGSFMLIALLLAPSTG